MIFEFLWGLIIVIVSMIISIFSCTDRYSGGWCDNSVSTSNIRSATESDVDVIHAMIQNYFKEIDRADKANSISRDDVSTRMSSRENCTIVYVIDGRVVAFIDSTSNIITNLYTIPEYRGKGIAKELLTHIIKEKKNLQLEVNKNRKIAQYLLQFYKGFGFDIYSEDDKVYKLRNYVEQSGLHTRIVGTGELGTIVLIPGLGNGIESYNWNLSTEEQRQKTHLGEQFASSLQDRIAELGYRVVCFDPPGHGGSENAKADFDEYISSIHQMSPVLIIGHSISGRIAQYYGEKYRVDYIMLDPTPDYILQSINYTKHIEDPANTKYQKTAEYVQMIKDKTMELLNAPWNPTALIYSIDRDDKNAAQKEKYFSEIGVKNKIRLDNATHWVHVSRPDVIVGAIKEWRRLKN